ncbi:glycosyltransferase [Pseudoalteromonas arctica]|uniref:glycosyltransferase n=1 Tax=Pseudoalteromonas arctica TaxID=394751 RepID=UPI002495A206|nr:glycosyltransferase [Pseudoalteromonas arctica]
MFIIKKLKKNPFLYALNCKFKAYRTKKLYQNIIKYYEKKSIEPFSTLNTRKLDNVFYFGGDEHQDKSGFLQGLSDVFNVKYFTQYDGKYGAYSRTDNNCKRLNSNRLVELFKEYECEGFIPDILLMQTWAWRVDVDTLIQIKRKYKCLIINIGMDDRHSYTDHGNWSQGTFGLIPALDLALTCAPECVEWYKKEGVDALFFPEASHSDFFYPMNIDRIYEVGFIGAKYGVRAEVVNALKCAGINVKCYGNGWPDGRLPLEDTNKFFNQCKIVLGIGTIGHTRDFYALKLRDFDALMAGSVYLTHKNPDLEMLFNNKKELFLADNVNDFAELATELLENEELLKSCRNRAYSIANAEHSYTVRFQMLKAYIKRAKVI